MDITASDVCSAISASIEHSLSLFLRFFSPSSAYTREELDKVITEST